MKRLREAMKSLGDALREQAERYLCTEIEPSEWDKAKAYAEQKLKGKKRTARVLKHEPPITVPLL